MAFDVKILKKIREETGYGVMDIRKALDETKGDEKKAVEILKKWGLERSESKKERETKAGAIISYIHGEGKVGVLLELLCETDFVARTQDFKNLAHELCLQISSMNPKDVKSLLDQEYIRDPKMEIQDLVKGTIGKLGENIIVSKFSRFQLGQS